MSLTQPLLRHHRSIGWLDGFLVITCLAAALNFVYIFVQTWKAASAAGTHIVDGYEITICYFGPPVGFYPRFFVFVTLLIATVGVFRRSFPRSLIAIVGVAAALSVYIYWWLQSYRVFRGFTDVDIDFLNNPEIKQAAYLYQGTWFDVCVAASIVVCFVLLLDRLLNPQRRVVASFCEDL
jgi:hypothetical protein